MTSQWLIAPVAVPAMTAAILVLVMRDSLIAQRITSSSLAVPVLRTLGYADVTELAGGMDAWQEAGRRLLAH